MAAVLMLFAVAPAAFAQDAVTAWAPSVSGDVVAAASVALRRAAPAPAVRPVFFDDAPAQVDAFQATRSRWVEGALAGAVIGGVATWLVIHSGDSTSLCDRDRNQDAIRANECLAIAAGGAVVGAGIGALVGSRIRTAARVDRFRLGLAPAGGVAFGVVAPAAR